MICFSKNKNEIGKHEGFEVHYAIKANANPKILKIISNAGLGADCVSGGEIKAVLDAGFPSKNIVFAGVGKSDWEINLGIDQDIFCFNVESIPELEIINELSLQKNKISNVCFRVNPDVGAHTHANITTGLAENKFGIAMADLIPVINLAKTMSNINFIGLHFHIGSQILEMGDFEALCNRINSIQEDLDRHDIKIQHINVGGGLGVSYGHPNHMPIPDFKDYFDTYAKHLKLRKGQKLNKQFAIVDAGMTDLIRPALYNAYHRIENISSDEAEETYDVVGPICESSDVFAKAIGLNKCHRGDLLVLRSAGAYGEIMASQYNCRRLPIGYLKEDL